MLQFAIGIGDNTEIGISTEEETEWWIRYAFLILTAC